MPAYNDNDLCTSEYPDTDNEGYIGHLCNLPAGHDGEHKALAEVGPGWRRHIAWPNTVPAAPEGADHA